MNRSLSLSALILVLSSGGAACGGSAPATAAAPPAAPAKAAAPLAACTVVEDVRVFDGAHVTERASVTFRDGRIVEIAPHPSVRCATVVQGAGKTLLPGLIDSHAHVWNDRQLAASLRFGVTTVLDMMTDPAEASKLRLEAKEHPEIADLRSAGNPVTSPGGHGTEYGLTLRTIASARDADAFVGECAREGSDYVKIIYTPDLPMFHSIDRDVLRDAAAAAHRRHLLAVVHIDTEREAKDALEAGADGLAHLFYDRAASKELVELARSRGAFVVPTLSVLRTISGKPHGAELARDERLKAKLGASDVAQLKAKYDVHIPSDEGGIVRSVQALHAAGVPILAGTDAPNPGTSHGVSMHGELELLVAAGLSPTEALASATQVPARAFRLDDRGRIAPGLAADLVLVEGNPTRDIRATRAITAVWRSGVRLSDEALAAVAPASAEASDAPKDEPPASVPKAAVGVISDFEATANGSRFGLGWSTSTDTIAGGTSVASLKRVRSSRAGKNAGKWSLAVAGTVNGPLPIAWSGAMLNPGDHPLSPVDLSAGKDLVFRARGDGGTYTVMVFTKARGRMPSRQMFVATRKWQEHRIPLRDFDGTDGSDVVGIAFVAGPKPGAYSFELDDVQLR